MPATGKADSIPSTMPDSLRPNSELILDTRRFRVVRQHRTMPDGQSITRETIEHPRPGLRDRYMAETSRELLPILRDARETWMVERLEELIERLGG